MIEVAIKEIHPIIHSILLAGCSKYPSHYKFTITKDDSILEFGNLFSTELISKHVEFCDEIYATATLKISGIIHHNSFWEDKISDATIDFEFDNEKYTVDKCNIQICNTGVVYISISNPIVFIM